jgi:amino acid adenylation domain-containing protein
VIGERFPLSPLQEAMLFQSLAVRGSEIVQAALTLREPLDRERLAHAWQEGIQRHDVLRTQFAWRDQPWPLQEIVPALDLPLEEQVWREEFLRQDRLRGVDPSRAPLWRLTLLRRDDGHELVFTFHHALLDGRSIALLLREVFGRYDGASGEASPTSFRDHAEWLAGLDLARSAGFWREQLHGITAPTPLPLDEAREEDPGHDEIGLRLSCAETAALGRAGVRLSTLLQASWALLLARHSGETDVVFGATRAGRGPGSRSTPGLFINTVPVRTRVGPDRPLGGWLRELDGLHEAIREHEHTPMAALRAWCEVPAERPLLESVVVYDERRRLWPDLWEEQGARPLVLHQQPALPLVLAGYGGEELVLRLTFERRRLAAGAASRLLAQVAHVLDELAAADPSRTLGSLSILPAGEVSLLEAWSGAAEAGEPDSTLDRLLAERVVRTPAALALDGDEQLDHASLDARARSVAMELRELGVGPDVVVGLWARRDVATVVGALGILKAGGGFLPLDAGQPRERLLALWRQAGAGVMVGHDVDPELAALARVVDPRTAVAEGPWQPMSRPDSLAYVIPTSGSTGQPKLVMVEHAGVVNMVVGQVAAFGLAPGDRVLQFAPPSVDAWVAEVFTTLVAGATLVLAEAPELAPGPPLLRLLRERQVTTLTLPPSALAVLPVPELPDLATLVVAGEACPPGLVARWGGARRMLNAYGPTEASVCVSVGECRPGEPVTLGRPLPGVRVHVLDDRLQPVPAGAAGELCVAGRGLARGYLGQPEAAAFVSSPAGRLYRTGDRVRFDGEGRLLFLGRRDRQVKVRGHRVEPAEVEAALLGHPAVRAAHVAAWGEAGDLRLAAWAVSTATGHELRRFLSDRLPSWMLPAWILPVAALPLLHGGKLDAAALRQLGAPTETARATVAPRTPLERRIAAEWGELLGLFEVGVHDHFFDVGGNSLLATRLLYRIREAFGVELPLRTLFAGEPTVAGLARAVEALLVEQASDADMADEMAALEGLSDDEVRALLASEADEAP